MTNHYFDLQGKVLKLVWNENEYVSENSYSKSQAALTQSASVPIQVAQATEGDSTLAFGNNLMVNVFTILAHATLALAAVGLLALIATIIFWFSPALQERIMRALAAACGLLIYVGAKAVGLSVPDLIYKSLSTTIPFSIGILGILLPSAAGVVLAWYVVRFLNSKNALHNVVGMRILSLIMTFVFFLYCDAYVAAYGVHEQSQFVYLLPNLSFVLSILLYALFKYHPLDPQKDTRNYRGS